MGRDAQGRAAGADADRPGARSRSHAQSGPIDGARDAHVGRGAKDARPQARPPSPRRERLSPGSVGELREQLTRGEDKVDPKTFAGAIPAASGIAPRLRVGAHRWFNVAWLLPIAWALLLVAVAGAQALRALPGVEAFIGRHPRTGFATSFATPFPAWLRAQHFLNLFFLVFIIRAGAQILADHPRLYWTRNSTPGKEWLRMQKEVPDTPLWTAEQDSLTLPKHLGLPGLRHSIGLARWWHLGVDTLWLANGLVFYVLLFATGEWRRIVPTSWQVFPDAASVLLQYASLRWPADDGWVAYNGLQALAYFVTVFVAAPMALVTGLGMSPALSTRFHGVSKRLSIQTARSLHFLVLCWFLLFILLHVTLVVATGALRNLNHVYAGTDARDWVGFGLFAASMAVLAIAWFAATLFTLRHPRVVQRAGFALVGPAQRLFEHVDAKPGTYTEEDVSRTSGTTASTPRRPSTARCSRAGSPAGGSASGGSSRTPSS